MAREWAKAVLAAAVVLGTTALVAVTGGPAAACTCGDLSQDELRAAADAVFVGTVIARQDLPNPSAAGPGYADWTFSVEQVIKGPVGSARQTLRTFLGGAACGYEFKVGTRYIVYATNSASGLTTGLCSGTDVLSQAVPTTVTTTTPATAPPVRVRLTG